MSSAENGATHFDEQSTTNPENDTADKKQKPASRDTNKKSSGKAAAERTRHSPSSHEAEGFPVDSENPFEHPCLGSDLVLVVEGKRLHVHKTLLVLHSPVFHRMLTADMKERNQKEIELPGRQHTAMVKFLLQMYPVHSLKSLKDDEDLTDILPLADFFQADHARLKCQNYIQCQTQQRPPEEVSRHSKMLYVYLCETYRLDYPLLASALDTAATLPLEAIINSSYYPQLQDATKVGLLERRCRLAEKAEASERERGSEGRRVVSAFCIKSRSSRLQDERCPSCRWVNWYCERCVQREVTELKEQFK